MRGFLNAHIMLNSGLDAFVPFISCDPSIIPVKWLYPLRDGAAESQRSVRDLSKVLQAGKWQT